MSRRKTPAGQTVASSTFASQPLTSFGRKEWKENMYQELHTGARVYDQEMHSVEKSGRDGRSFCRCFYDQEMHTGWSHKTARDLKLPPATLSSDSQPLSSTRVHHQPLAYHGGQQQHDTSNKQLLATTSRY